MRGGASDFYLRKFENFIEHNDVIYPDLEILRVKRSVTPQNFRDGEVEHRSSSERGAEKCRLGG